MGVEGVWGVDLDMLAWGWGVLLVGGGGIWSADWDEE